MRIILAILFAIVLLTANCFGAPIKKVGDTFHGKVGNVDFEVGAIVSNKIKPQLKLVKWGEDSLIVNFPSMGSINKTAASTNGSTVTFVCHAGKLLVYVTDDGHLEYEGVFNSVPWSSVQLTLTGWENFDFFYQGPLTEQEIADGCVRPENVVGSYAVYHKTKKNNQYQTGKAFHIFRPCWIAADGQRLWITQTIANGVWTLSWSKAWTDAAAKPLILDPTIGWTSAGASYASWNEAFNVAGSIYGLTPTGTNIVNSVSIYGKNASDQELDYLYIALYGDSAGYAGAKLTGNYTASPMPATFGWITTAGDMNYELAVSTKVHAVYSPVDGVFTYVVKYDNSISGETMALDWTTTLGNPFSLDATYEGRRMSVYLNYSTGGGSPAPSVPLLPQVMTWEN